MTAAGSTMPPASHAAYFPSLLHSIKQNIRELSPAYFAMVMATGTSSLACHFLGYRLFALALFALNIVFYLVLVVLFVLRVILHWDRFATDLIDHQRGPGFFTSVAGSCVLGVQFEIIAESHAMATLLCAVAALVWVALTYTIFTAFTVKENKPDLAHGISGAWLLAVVATQALAVLSAVLSPRWPQPYRLELNFFALSMWLWGGMLYIWMMSLIFYRYTFFAFSPGDLSPPYWINMGAMAISALGGSRLIMNAPDAPFLLNLLPFLKGFTVFYWATGTWWIPMLVILACWRYIYKRYPLKYNPLYWGAVFPLAMYTVCTYSMARALNLPFLQPLPRIFVFVALAAWLAAFVGLVRRVIHIVVSAGKSIDVAPAATPPILKSNEVL